MQADFRVRWAELQQENDAYMLDRQAKRMSKIAGMLKRAGFVLSSTDESGWLIYLKADRPAPKRRGRCV